MLSIFECGEALRSRDGADYSFAAPSGPFDNWSGTSAINMSAAAAQSVDLGGRPVGLAVSCFAVLKACCADQGEDERRLSIREAMRDEPDCDELPALAQRHGVVPRVVGSLEATDALGAVLATGSAGSTAAIPS